jgi:hypothetical protein
MFPGMMMKRKGLSAVNTVWDTSNLLMQSGFENDNVIKDGSNEISRAYVDASHNRWLTFYDGDRPTQQSVNGRGLALLDNANVVGYTDNDTSVDGNWFLNESGLVTRQAARTMHFLWFAPISISTNPIPLLSYQFWNETLSCSLMLGLNTTSGICRPVVYSYDLSLNQSLAQSTSGAIAPAVFHMITFSMNSSGQVDFYINGDKLTNNGGSINNEDYFPDQGGFRFCRFTFDEGVTSLHAKGRLCEWLIYGIQKSDSQVQSDYQIARARWNQ